MTSKSEYEIDGWIAFVFIFVPSMLIFLLSMGLAMLNLSPLLAVLGYSFYFLVPFLFLKLSFEYETKPAFKFAVVVPVVAIFTEIPFYFIFGA